ncbi:MAG TPA: hypothetical protein VFA19_05865 [Gaiellaceae bacterium]|nr:hypothetical protein [Gaiellaceae bacterium]
MTLVVETPHYRLEVRADGMLATILGADGGHLLDLRPLAALDAVDAPDETLEVEAPRRLDERTIEVRRRSTRWHEAATTLVCADDTVDVRSHVAGEGALAAAHLLAARSLAPGRPTGFLPSGTSFRTLFSPNPGDPAKLVRPATEPAVVGVAGDGTPGRGNWFFTPAPLWLGFTTAELGEPAAADWVGLGLAAPVERLTFVELAYRTFDRGFSLEVDYEGHTRVDGRFEAPTLVLSFGARDPYDGLRRHRDELAARGAAPAPRTRRVADWWSEPIFCGWGAQCARSRAERRPASAFATQAEYDAFLGRLEREGVVPGTVVVDDKWQSAYGTNEPDPAKWPDLRGWIARRHDRGQHVLLWWKAWDAEGVPPELSVRTPDGRPVAIDPTHPGARELIGASIERLLAPSGLDADGLKIDFTARTPSGRALATHGDGWGIALLHELLAVVRAAAKRAKPDALLVTQTPHPAFVDVADMIRLNDMLRLDDRGPFPPVVPQMRFRAAVAHAACPELLVDTDDWCVPSRDEWRAYLEAKSELGVPALYYADAFDWTGELLEPEDYEALRRVWSAWREELAA